MRALVDGLVGGIVAHNLSLIDPFTGQPTTWGKFSPHWLNDVADWSDDRGLRAIEMLTYLVAAEEVTGDAKYRQTADELRAAHGSVPPVHTFSSHSYSHLRHLPRPAGTAA